MQKVLFLSPRARLTSIDEYLPPASGESAPPYLGVSANRRMFTILGITLTVVGGIFIARAAYLQMIRGPHYRAVAEENRIRIETLPAMRGLIYDRRGVLLVQNVPRFVLAVRPIDIPENIALRGEVLAVLEEFQIDPVALSQVLDEHQSSADWISIKEPLDHAEAIQLIGAIEEFPGFMVRLETRREYLQGDTMSLSHILGYVGKPTAGDVASGGVSPATLVGKTGVERTYGELLGGADGQKQVEVNALGEEKKILAWEHPRDGTNLVLTIDAALQGVSERALRRGLSAVGKKRGAVVVMDPGSGEVLALVSLPTFDNNHFSAGLAATEYAALANDPDEPLFPRAIAGTYPSGSTIKPIFAAAALSEGVITPNTTIISSGGVKVGRWFFPDWRAGGHGAVTVREAIAESVNTFFYYIGGGFDRFRGLGPDQLALWAERFGFGRTNGIDLPTESAGLVPTPTWKETEMRELWYIGDTYHFAIGQGYFTVSPLQLTSAVSAIANGGTLYQPRVAKAFRSSRGGETPIPSEVRSNIPIDGEDFAIIREGMRQTVTAGSARSLATVSIPVAGKTGTAEWNSKRPPHAWFTGFAPDHDPEIAVTVLVEEGGEGSRAAVTIAKEIFTWYALEREE